MPKFSIILATRDRPLLFNEAMVSVVGQDYQDFEIIVVDDGSTDENKEKYVPIYEQALKAMGNRFKVTHLIRRPRGHGQSYSLNYGVDQATGEFVLFLDDDDTWTDMSHLSRVNQATLSYAEIDIFMTNQNAYLSNVKKTESVWLENFERDLLQEQVRADSNKFYSVPLDILMKATGFCHLNCLTVRRTLYQSIGGMDEGIRWECDRDIFLRLVDCAKFIVFSAAFVSRHNIPDPSKSLNMSTTVSTLEKRLFQLRVFDKAALFSKQGSIRAHAMLHKSYTLKKMATELAEREDWLHASHYAKEAFGVKSNFKWFAFTLYCIFRKKIA